MFTMLRFYCTEIVTYVRCSVQLCIWKSSINGNANMLPREQCDYENNYCNVLIICDAMHFTSFVDISLYAAKNHSSIHKVKRVKATAAIYSISFFYLFRNYYMMIIQLHILTPGRTKHHCMHFTTGYTYTPKANILWVSFFNFYCINFHNIWI